jgi:glycosyltransferase involved in cell wall biosynthesis
MVDLNVLITTYHQAFLNKGGGEFELIEVASNLRELGVKADVYSPKSCPLSDYDVVLHFSMHSGGIDILRHIKNTNKRIVLWPNLWWVNDPTESEREIAKTHVSLADAVVFKSHAEMKNLNDRISIPKEKVHIIPAGIDRCFGYPADEDMFKIIYNVDEYILWLGIIEEQKNQLFCINALKNIKLPIVFVGNYRDRGYYNACKTAAPKHFKFLPSMPAKSEILRSAMQNCRLFLEVPLDHPGLSALEAGLAGSELVLSDDPWSKEHFGNRVTYVDPRSEKSIECGVNDALQKPHDPTISKIIHSKHLYPQALTQLLQILQR